MYLVARAVRFVIDRSGGVASHTTIIDLLISFIVLVAVRFCFLFRIMVVVPRVLGLPADAAVAIHFSRVR